MIEILGKKYITSKEASKRYGFSYHWFKIRRSRKQLPAYVKIGGKVLYEINNTDNWFQDNMRSSDE